MSADRFNNGNRSPRCLAVGAQLFDYVDSSLSTLEMQTVDTHLAECETCRLELEHVRRAEAALLSSSLSIPAPGDLYGGFTDKLAARQSKTPILRLRHLGPAFALAVLALVLIKPTHRDDQPRAKTGDTASQSKTATFALNDAVGSRELDIADFDRNDSLSSRVTSREHIKAPARNGRHAGERSIALLLARVEVRNTIRYKTEATVQDATIDGVQVADDFADLPSDASKKQIPQLHTPDAAGRSFTATNLYAGMDAPQRDRRLTALGLRSLSDNAPEAEQRSGSGFALVVEDDVRGFTAEAHNTASSALPASQTGTVGDDGVKVEIEFDDAAGTGSF